MAGCSRVRRKTRRLLAVPASGARRASVPTLAPAVRLEQCPDVIEAFDAHDLLGVELAPDLHFEREHEAQVGQAVPALERFDARALRHGGELRMDRLASNRRA